MVAAPTRACCHARVAQRPVRRAQTRVQHQCRGRGGRGCRCHRPHLVADGQILRWHPLPAKVRPQRQVLHHPPQSPQAPPRFV